MAGILLLPLIGLVSAVVDHQNAAVVRHAMQATLDGAVMGALRKEVLQTQAGAQRKDVLALYGASRPTSEITEIKIDGTAAERRVRATAQFGMPRSFGAAIGLDPILIEVRSAALVTISKPVTRLRFRAISGNGSYHKQAQLIKRDASGLETSIWSMRWVGTASGSGSFASLQSDWVDIQGAAGLYLSMTVQTHPPGIFGQWQSYSVRTDRTPRIRQFKRGSTILTSPIDIINGLACGQRERYSFEDGGDNSYTDFVFEVEGGCQSGGDVGIPRMIR